MPSGARTGRRTLCDRCSSAQQTGTGAMVRSARTAARERGDGRTMAQAVVVVLCCLSRYHSLPQLLRLVVPSLAAWVCGHEQPAARHVLLH